MDLTYNHDLIKSLSSAIMNGEGYLENVPGLFKKIANINAWMKHTTEFGETITPKDFKEFVEKQYPFGLGTKIDILEKLIKDDKEALSIFTRLKTAKPGGDRQSCRHKESNNYNIMNGSPRQGTSKQYALRKLRKDAPELHQLVLNDELSSHAAMVKAGFRKKTVTIVIEPEAFIKAIHKHFSDKEIEIICNLLTR